jgi:hypothetical protein
MLAGYRMSKIDEWILETDRIKVFTDQDSGCLALGGWCEFKGCELLLVTQYLNEEKTIKRRCLKFKCRKYTYKQES